MSILFWKLDKIGEGHDQRYFFLGLKKNTTKQVKRISRCCLFVGRDFQGQKKRRERSKQPLHLSDPVKTQTLADSWSSGRPPTFFHHPCTGQ
jgi:hypothetical protein